MAVNNSEAPARGRVHWLRAIVTAALTLAGVGMALPGLYLVTLGGSAYYLITGLAIVAAAVLVLRARRAGLALYGLIVLFTLAWSVWEVGLDGWGLMPRLVFLVVAGLVLLAVSRGLTPSAPRLARVFQIAAALGVAAVAASAWSATQRPSWTLAGSWGGAAQPTAGDGQWTHFGASLRGSRYAPLDEITPNNAANLEQAWVYHTGLKIKGGTRQGGLQVTPLMADGRVYACTAFSAVFALDPVTGKELWRHDPTIADDEGGHAVCRGVAWFQAAAAADCPTRVLVATISNKLMALDARTGQLCRSFGTGGEVDLREGVGDFPKRWSHPTSPPTIVNGVAVVGAYVVDNQSTTVPPGVVRGYDATTGQIKWAFDPGRPNDTRPLPTGQTYTPATPNSWTVASGDEQLGLVYVATGNGSPDFVGSHRTPETERFTSSVVALDAATGAVRWTFQAVHHDLWDYDVAAQPVLTDVMGAPALLLPTKTGQVFVLDRRTGRPLTPVEERPAPPSDVPGERASPTQPYSVGMPDFAGPDMTEADMWGVTPFDQLWCRLQFRKARYVGRYTPPRLGLTLRYPGELGGIDWGSVSVDEGRGLLVVNSNHMADRDELITRAQAEKEGLVPRTNANVHSAPGGPMAGTPYAIHWGPFLSGLGVPCQRPPYGYLAAVDLKTRKLVWRRTIGDARNSGPFGWALRLRAPLGAPNIGGSITTKGGLVFIAATQDEVFRAIDVATGKTVWEQPLPAAGHATPMSYRGPDGHQYVVIAAGGRALRDKPGDEIIAYRLKR